MDEERLDVIVVGGGISGLSAAITTARAGLATMLIERGNYSGSKNVTGGRLYLHNMEGIFPGLAGSGALERKVVQERLTLFQDGRLDTVTYDAPAIQTPGGDSYTVLRGTLDRWLSEQAEAVGVLVVNGVLVDELLVREGAVCGVIAAGEEMEASVVVLADGVNSLLAQQLGMREQLQPDRVTLGVKEVIELGADVINQRFGLADGEGLCWMLLDWSEDERVSSGFLYTNAETVSLGITMRVDQIDNTENTMAQMMEDFKNSPMLAPLVAGGRMLEYAAHLIPEGGGRAIPKLYGDGVLLAGDAAGLCANLGFTLRGMDLAAESGRLAAETVLLASEKGDFSSQELSGYQAAIEHSFLSRCISGAERCMEALRSEPVSYSVAAALSGIVGRTLV